MTPKKKIELCDYLIDYLCECNGIRDTIKILFDAGCTNQELQEMGFDKEDIDIVREENLNDIRG